MSALRCQTTPKPSRDAATPSPIGHNEFCWSQPVFSTAFRSRLNPEHRVFTSLLMTEYFDPKMRSRIETLLAPRNSFNKASATPDRLGMRLAL